MRRCLGRAARHVRPRPRVMTSDHAPAAAAVPPHMAGAGTPPGRGLHRRRRRIAEIPRGRRRRGSGGWPRPQAPTGPARRPRTPLLLLPFPPSCDIRPPACDMDCDMGLDCDIGQCATLAPAVRRAKSRPKGWGPPAPTTPAADFSVVLFSSVVAVCLRADAGPRRMAGLAGGAPLLPGCFSQTVLRRIRSQHVV